MNELATDALLGGAQLLPTVVVALVLVFAIFWQIHKLVELVHTTVKDCVDGSGQFTLRVQLIPPDDEETDER